MKNYICLVLFASLLYWFISVTWQHRPNHSASRVAAARSMDRCGAVAVIMAFLVLQQMSRMRATAVFQYGINFSNYESFRRSVGFVGRRMGRWKGLIMLYVPECLRFLKKLGNGMF
jgi:hypothetical protein